MLGGILGDMVGSYCERNPWDPDAIEKALAWGEYSDDTVLTIATMDKLLSGRTYQDAYRFYYRGDSNRDYGRRFSTWAESDSMDPYGSYGNGAAMRISPIAFIAETPAWLENEIQASSMVTHNHPKAIQGANAVAWVIFWLRRGKTKRWIMHSICERFDYACDVPLVEMKIGYDVDLSAEGSVPQAIRCFLESKNLRQAIANAIDLEGDMDTIACMSGAMAEAAYGIDQALANKVLNRLPEGYKKTTQAFYAQALGRRF